MFAHQFKQNYPVGMVKDKDAHVSVCIFFARDEKDLNFVIKSHLTGCVRVCLPIYEINLHDWI